MSYLGIDVGTSRIKAIAFDEQFGVLAQSSIAQRRISPRPGWCEIDAGELVRAVGHAIKACSRQCMSDPIRWISFCVFGGGVSAIDRKLQPLLNVISTTDSRAREETARWIREFGKRRTYEITGTTTHSSLMLPKIIWIRTHLHDASKVHKFVTAAELVLASLGLEPKMDHATASTTMMLDIARKRWSEEILQFARIPEPVLPAPIPPGDIVAEVPSSVCEELGLARGCTVVAGGHDQQVCALGAGLIEVGQATDSLGTVECITTLFERPVLNDDLLENNFSNMLHVHGGKIASLAYSFSCGDLLDWHREVFFQGGLSFEEMFSRLPREPSTVLVLPHFSGSGTPYLDVRSKGAVIGLSLQTDPLDILRGVIDSQNYEMRLNLEIWVRNGVAFNTLKAYGKGSSCDTLLQIKADILDLEVQKLNVFETGCLGAALLAAKGADSAFPLEEVFGKVVQVERTFQPRSEFAEQHQERFALYKDVYPRLKEIHHRM